MAGSARRLGIAVGATAALLFVAGAFVLQGYTSVKTATAAAAAAAATPEQTSTTVYVRPASSPEVIHVTQTASPQPAPVVHIVVPGGGDDENEGNDD